MSPQELADICAGLGGAGVCSVCLTESGVASPEVAAGMAVAIVLLLPTVLRFVAALATAVAAAKSPKVADEGDE